MKAAARLANDIWQPSVSQREAVMGNENYAECSAHQEMHRPALLTWTHQYSGPVTGNPVLGHSQCPSTTEGGRPLWHPSLSTLYSLCSSRALSALPSSLLPILTVATHWVPTPTPCPNFLPRPASCSQPQCPVSAAWSCPSQLIFMDLTLGPLSL